MTNTYPVTDENTLLSGKAVSNKISQIGTGVVTVTQAGVQKASFTLNQSENVSISLTDTNTWRGITSSLTSTDTSISLSASAGKTLNDRLTSVENGKAGGGASVTNGGSTKHVRIVQGCLILKPSSTSTSCKLLTFAEIDTILGLSSGSSNQNNTVILVSNNNGDAVSAHVEGATAIPSSKTWYVVAGSNWGTTSIQVGYVIFYGYN